MKNKTTNFEQYAMTILHNLSGTFQDEEENDLPLHLDIDKLDATAYFTACAYALCLHFNSLTDNNKNAFEFTQTLTQLVVQNMMEEK